MATNAAGRARPPEASRRLPSTTPAEWHGFRKTVAVAIRRFLCLAAALVLVIAEGCDAPRDPRKTLERVRGHVLTAGVSEDPPFIVRRGNEADGIEADLIRGFARELGATVTWVWGSQEQQFLALHGLQLDLVAGGLTAKTPWKASAAITRPFVELHEVVATHRGIPPPVDLKAVEIAIEEGDPVGEALEKEKAHAKRVPHLDGSEMLAAGTRTRLLRLGYLPFRELKSEERVLAVPQGENAFLEALEKYLAAHHEAVSRAAGEEP
jgi:polar amino acid transport system substrate-binding protein